MNTIPVEPVEGMYRRILPGLRRLTHLKSILVRNLDNRSTEPLSEVYFTLHCVKHEGDERNDVDEDKRVIVYKSEIVTDTNNPEWNEFGYPEVIDKDYINEKECILRVWEIENGEHKVCINMDINIQELEYVVHLEPEGVPSLDDYSKIFNRIMAALPFNAVLFRMKDGYFASHELCSFLREKKVLEPLYVSQPVNGSTCDFHFIMTAMQTLCMRQSHVGRQDERMELMKGMVTEAMEAPMKQNAADVKTRCLRSDVENMNKEVQQLTESLEKEKEKLKELEEYMTTSIEVLENHHKVVSSFETTVEDLNTEIDQLNEEDNTNNTSLMARRTRLLSFLAMIYPITVTNGVFTIGGHALPEKLLLQGHVKDLKISEVNAAMGYLTRVILLLSKYFMTPLLFSIDYRSSFSVITEYKDKPEQYPLFIASNLPRDPKLAYGVQLLRRDLEVVLASEGISLESMDMLEGVSKLFSKYILFN